MDRTWIIGGAALALGLCGDAVQAAITADQLWAAWQKAGAELGLVVKAGSTARDGATLRLRDVTLTPAVSGLQDMRAATAEVTLTEGADGSVTVVPAPELVATAEGGAEAATLTLAQDGLRMVVTELLGEMRYEVTGAGLSARFASVVDSAGAAENSPVEQAAMQIDVALADVALLLTDVPARNRSFSVDLAARHLSYDVRSDNPALQMKTTQTSVTEAVAITGTFDLPTTIALADLTTPEAWAQALREGMALRLKATQGASRATSKDENPFLPMDMTISSLPGATELALGKAGFSLLSTGEGAGVTATSPMLPFPQLDVAIGPLVVSLAVPILTGVDAGVYGLTLKLADMVVNEAAWAAIDPGAVLPRDPAQLSVETSGTMKIDLFALMAAESAGMTDVTPPEPLTLEIAEVQVSVAGARLTGSGSFRFDNTSGQPVPVGTAAATLTGGNGLIDALVLTGILTEEDAGGARMLMAMFMDAGAGAGAGAGADVLTSEVKANADGSILVNGQRVQ